MTSMETLTTFFGWCIAINASILVVALVVFGVAHEWAGRIMAGIFGITSEGAKLTIFHVFQQYRLAFIVLNVVPYIALKIMIG